VPWDDIDPDQSVGKHAPGKLTLAALDIAEPFARANIKKVEPVRTQLKAVRDLAGTIETKWKTSKVIPSSSRAPVGNMKTTADQLFIALKSIDNDWKQAREKAKKEAERQKTIALGLMWPYFASIRQIGRQVKATPTVAVYIGGAGKGFHQNVRGLNAALAKSGEPAWIFMAHRARY
jgi:hypothetical protein